MLELNKIYLGDCLEVMDYIADKSIDMILCDLPYGSTSCRWDTIIPFEPLWKQYKRIVKDTGAIVLFGNEPFASHLRLSNLGWYKYDWYMKKNKPGGFLNAKKMPLKAIETISVFYKKQVIYNPQELLKINKTVKNTGTKSRGNKKENGDITSAHNLIKKKFYKQEYTNYPTNIVECSNGDVNTIHPTQKSVPLFEYLIKTYTNEGDLILDNCAGSGTTGIAAFNLDRDFILIEKDETYFQLAKDRIEKHMSLPVQRELL